MPDDNAAETPSENPENLNVPPLPAPTKAEWTIMVYMAGDNNLAQDCVNALLAMKRVSTGDRINVVSQFDPSDPRVKTRRLVVNLAQKQNRDELQIVTSASIIGVSELALDNVKVEEGTVKFSEPPRRAGATTAAGATTEETDTADPKTLFDFISWCQREYPAKRTMLILSGHGAGVQAGYLLKDENPPDAMTLSGLKKVLEEVQNPEKLGLTLDILGMDCCLMSMVEICYELRGLAKVIVASQSMTPNPGWPYQAILEAMGDGDIDERTLAERIVNLYVNSYVEHAVNSGLSTDLAALDVDASTELAESLKILGGALRDSLSQTAVKNALILAHWEAQSYNGELFIDLCDFCELLETRLDEVEPATNDGTAFGAIREGCALVKAAIEKLVLAACFCGIDYQYSNGVSVYFPWSIIFEDYNNLAFAKDTGADWFKFLTDYTEKTRRAPRGGEDSGPSQLAILPFAEFETRRQPPYDHGPVVAATSMRNPPIKWGKKGIRECINKKAELTELFTTFA
jgi:hypothetical protein